MCAGDASIALGKSSTADADAKSDADWKDVLSPSEVETLEQWESNFLHKYPVVGRLVRPEAEGKKTK